MGVKRTKLSSYSQDEKNANRGTQRGYGALEHSLRQYGAGRSVLVDKNGKLIAGNKTAEKAFDIGIEDAIEVETDGRQLVVVKRTDLDLDTDPEARALAIADNRVGELSLEWSAEVLAELAQEVDLTQLFTDDEMAAPLEQAGTDLVNFEPGSIDEQGRLDEKAKCTCPSCGHVFTP